MDDKIIYNEIGKLVKKERKKKKITQEQLTSYSLSFIANIESNTYQSFSIHTLYNIANALDISINKLLPDKNELIEKKYILICNHCKLNVNIPKEIGKLLEDIEKINSNNTYTCPNCKEKKMMINIEKE